MNRRSLFAKLFYVILAVFFGAESKAQSYGLGFYSHEVEAGKRTTLELFPGKGFEAREGFELSFEVSFLANQADYFGTIFHMESPQRNIDLTYTKSRLEPDLADPFLFKLINGDHPSKINFNIVKEQILGQWNRIKLTVDFTRDRLILQVNNKKYVEEHAQLVRSTYEFIWGISGKNSDCPPMKIRNIRLENNKLKYFWPLNEVSGSLVREANNEQNASVTNPSWIRAMHRNWKFREKISVRGNASIAFNEKDAELYLIGPDSLITYQVNQQKVSAQAYRSGRQILPLSNQSIYDAREGKLYNYYLDRDLKQVNTYDFKLNAWDKNYPANIMKVDFQNASNFFSLTDSSIYIVGGYGHFLYKNEVQRYNTKTKSITGVKTKGDYLWPRYLAAAGTADSGRTAYILGGYGSYTGRQVVNPQNLYDLVKLDIKTGTFKKIFDLKPRQEQFAFVGSMLINDRERTFTTLTFPNNRYNSYLRLFQGNLDKPDYQLVGDSIPYKFHDVRGSANLYYNRKNKTYIAVTLLKGENDLTTASIYTLLGPADGSIADEKNANHALVFWLIAIGLCGIAMAIAYRIFKRAGQPNPDITPAAEPARAELTLPGPDLNPGRRNAIFLFGDMQLINQDGIDITGQFTSLLKELFLHILISSLKSARGIPGEKLAELLWPDKSESSAKNNRDANLSRLKGVLSQANDISLSKESGNWKINIDDGVIYFDYHHYLQIVANRKHIDKAQICQLIGISQRGNFLSGFEYQWLDQMKSEISNEIVNIYLEYAQNNSTQDDPEFLIKIANNIFYLDSVNEEALAIKCKALSSLGKHSLAKSSFENFTKEFKTLYGEDFKRDFNSVLES
ncbi:MAG: galactose oxidase [Bacteroidota bacterium]